MSRNKTIPHSRPFTGKAEAEAVAALIRKRQITTGQTVTGFETAFRKTIGMKYAVAVSSGSSALHLALLSLNIGKGGSVIIPDYACTALLNCVNMVGATPVLADAGKDTPNLTPESVAAKMNGRVKTIIIPHLFGLAQDLSPFKRFGVPLIEDCAQTFGFKINGKNVGSQGDISIFSFYATKLLCTGEGGMLLTNAKPVFKTAQDLRDYDERDEYRIRFNYKMTDLEAAMGLIQLKQLPLFLRRRKALAQLYIEALNGSDVLPIAGGSNNIYFRFIIRGCESADQTIRELGKMGIRARKPIFKTVSGYLGKRSLPNSGKWQDKAVSIPIYPGLSKRESEMIIKSLKRLSAGGHKQ